MKATGWFTVAAASLGALAAPSPARAASETFTATILQQAGGWQTASRTWPLTFHVERWTSPQEIARLEAALVEGGPDALLREFQKRRLRAGYVTSTGITSEPSWPVALATVRETPRGRVVRLVTDRPLGFAEAWSGSRSREYPFAVFEFTLDGKGRGQGIAITAARLVDDGEDAPLTFETLPFTTGPDRLLAVRQWQKD